MRRQQKVSPRTARPYSLADGRAIVFGEYWCMVAGGEVIIKHQKRGEAPQAECYVPRRAFNRFVDWHQQ